jgi:hypothetical protein
VRWLVTAAAGTEPAQVAAAVEPLGGSLVEGAPAVPLDDELAFSVEGPPDLPERLREHATCILGAYPDSEVEPFDLP